MTRLQISCHESRRRQTGDQLTIAGTAVTAIVLLYWMQYQVFRALEVIKL